MFAAGAAHAEPEYSFSICPPQAWLPTPEEACAVAGESLQRCDRPEVNHFNIFSELVAPGACHLKWQFTETGNPNQTPRDWGLNLLVSTREAAPQSEVPLQHGMCVANPILPATGEKYRVEADWTDSSPSPLSFVRTYRSRWANDASKIGGPLGQVWSHNFATSLVAYPSSAPVRVTIVNSDGTQRVFKKLATATVWTAANSPDNLSQVSSGGWIYRRAQDDATLSFDPSGKLQTTTDRSGLVTTYLYNSAGHLASVTNPFGRVLTFTYADKKLASIGTPDGQVTSYSYDTLGRLISVQYPDGNARSFVYENAAFTHGLTGIYDESGIRWGTFAYDAQARAISTSLAGGADHHDVGYAGGGAASVTDPLGTPRTYGYSFSQGKLAVTSASLPSSGGSSDAANRVQNALGLIDSETDFRGFVTSHQWDITRRLPLSTTQAFGTPEARTTTTEWHPQWRLPVKFMQTGRETSYTYDSLGNVLTQSVKDTTVTPVVTRAWSWTYHPSGLVATETDPNGAVSSFTYDSAGNLTQSTNALNRVDTYTHDAAGRVLTHTAVTGLASSFQYDLRGRLTRVQRGDEATVYTYRPTGQVATVTTPSGYAITYTYDAAQRLTGWSDNRGASATYTLDGMGNRVAESVKDSQSQTAWQVARAINSLNRVESVTIGGGAGTGAGAAAASAYGYDANGDLIRSTETVDGSTRNTTLGLDALRRVKTLTNAQNASAALEYNALDAVTKATDFKSVATTYARDALGNATQEATPDSGTLTSSYDSLGLPQSITDALGRATSITRDALGRPTQIMHTQGGASRTTVLRYDLAGADYNAPGAPQASIGALSEIQDPDVTTRYQRDLQGRITAKTQILAGGSRSVTYSYVPAGQGGAGQVQNITYPSGKQLTHVYDATGQLTALHWAGQPLVTGLAWNPLGQPTDWQWPGFTSGPGATQPLAEIRNYTTAGQLAGSALLNLTWDSAGRLRQVQQKHMLPGTATTPQQVTLTSAYTYDSVGRLTASAHNGGPNLVLPTGYSLSDTIGPNAVGYSYDANGNRSQVHYSITTPAGTNTLQRTYQTSAGTNRLSGYSETSQAPGNSAQTTTVAYSHDGAGALTKRGDNHLHHGIDGRIAKTGLNASASHPQAVSYTYNLLGQRLLKSDARLTGNVGTPSTQQTVYAEDGIGSTVLGQYRNQRSSDSGAPAGEMDSTEVIYLPTANGPLPIATQINGRLYAIDSDHLNTPRRLTNQQGQVAWQWLLSGYGEVAPTIGHWGFVHSNNSRKYSEAVKFDLRYPGQQWDEETGLAYNLHRYYDALTGRYVQADPIGLEGGWNRFGYVDGDPLNFADAEGLQKRGSTPAVSWGQAQLNFQGISLTNQIRQYQPNYAPTYASAPGQGFTAANIGQLRGVLQRVQSTGSCSSAPNLITPVNAVISETLNGHGNLTSAHRLSASDLLSAGQHFLGSNYREIGKPGSGVFRSADGRRQFRIDGNSLTGSHAPGIPHGHLETYFPGSNRPAANNHIPFFE